MPPWGRPPGVTDVGRYFEGVEEDVHRFQEFDSEDEKNGVLLNRGSQQVSNGKHLNSDELYFNDMDIRAWERRAAALGEMPRELGFDLQEEDEGYYDDAGEAVSHAEYEELLFRRVLDKIRVARATGDSDIQLSAEELDAYQARLHGTKAPAVRPQSTSHPPTSPILDDTASIISTDSAGRHGHTSSGKSKSKKGQPRTSMFSSKPKKEKPSSRKRAISNVSIGSGNISPGFAVPGPDGQPTYTPVNPYQGSVSRDHEPLPQPAPRSASGNSQVLHAYSRMVSPQQSPREVPGAFPNVFGVPTQPHRPPSPPRQGRPTGTRQSTQKPTGSHSRSSSLQSTKLMPFPLEPYQYHNFSPVSSSSQPSPQVQYTRRPSVAPSEASYTTIPRRVPVPAQSTASLVSIQRNYTEPPEPQASYTGAEIMEPSDYQGFPIVEVVPQPIPIPLPAGPVGGRDGERRRKGGGKGKKKG
ncbi:hypothetical protein GQ44DRAFT_193734 [Phaeosphaeriaceae sp. PMI808]|nr:hypothetical protein GQ44DRAFT_193734 [Phaeosphaeriaceae sp. PMI808]